MLGNVSSEYNGDNVYVIRIAKYGIIFSFGYSNINKIFWLHYDSCCPV